MKKINLKFCFLNLFILSLLISCSHSEHNRKIASIEGQGQIEGCQKIIDQTANYIHCVGKIPSYPQPVHLFIPTSLQANDPINLNIHFHGFNLNGYSHFNKKYADYGNYLAASKLNSVFIVPESLGNDTTYNNFFTSSAHTFQFINDAKDLFSPLQISSLSFSGHSGAYKVLNMIFSYPQLEEATGKNIIGIAFFDATYAPTDNVQNFVVKQIKKKRPFLFFDSYIASQKSPTQPMSLNLKSNLNRLLPSGAKPNYNFVPYPTDSRLSTIDQHFGIIKVHGILEYLSGLNELD